MVTKEDVKSFVRAVRVEMDARYNAKFATIALVAALKSDFGALEDTVANIDTSSDVAANDDSLSQAALALLVGNDSFDGSDVLEVFAD